MLARMKTFFMMTLLGALLLGSSAGVQAGESSRQRLREAVQRNEVLSLRVILARIESEFEGRVIEVEIDDDDGQLIYEIDLLTPEGRVLELELDARSGALLNGDQRKIARARRNAQAQTP